MREVYVAIGTADPESVLATVVRVEGSAYRREGAKMLLPNAQAAQNIGMISGGCLEEDVRANATDTFAAGRPQIFTYDMRSEEDGLWGLNMGCNGLVDVLVERVGPELKALATEYLAGRACTTMAVVTAGSQRRNRVVWLADGTVVGSLGSAALDQAAVDRSREWRGAGLLTVQGVEVYAERVVPQPLLWVVGGGADAEPLVRAAVAAGWRVRVVDRRAQYADSARFPLAEAVQMLEPEELAGQAGSGAFAVFMFHNFDHDRDYLQAMLGTGARYLGVLGPLRRTLLILESAELPPEVYAPVGLDIGGEGPEAISAAIVAEILAVLHGRPAGHLRGYNAPLHR